jgi:ABC-type dipeptide/oligopeptide/nickel transport system ATPase component
VTNAAPLLAVHDLCVNFGPSRVVDRDSFTVDAGEKFAVVGESGSGKSVTALSILKLIETARYEGEIRFLGENVLAKSERQMQALRGSDIAMIFQEPMTALNPLYTVGNQIAEVLELHEGLGKAQAHGRVIELLARTGIPEPERRVDAFPHQLSGGQRQRAMIAMALACRPKLLIADEPTTALDVTIQTQILALLDDLQREYGMAILFITHDLNLVRRFTHRVGVMEKGRMVEQGLTAEVFSRPRHPYTIRLINSRPERAVRPVAPMLPCSRPRRRQRGIRHRARMVRKGTLPRGARGDPRVEAGRNARHRRRIRVGEDHARHGAAGAAADCGRERHARRDPPRQRRSSNAADDAPPDAGGLPGSVRLAVAPDDGRADRRRGRGAAPAGAVEAGAAQAHPRHAGRGGPVGGGWHHRPIDPLSARVLRRPAATGRDRARGVLRPEVRSWTGRPRRSTSRCRRRC